MKMTIKSELVWSFVTLCGLVLCLSPFSIPVLAQTSTVGYNAVCTSSACNTASLTTSSPAFIDASVSATLNHTDLCATILNILTSNLGNPPYPSIGAVIDARGLTNLGCSTGTPWNNGSGTSSSAPSTILLPGGTIVIPTTWILPSSTRLIGQGDTIVTGTSSAPSAAHGTVLQACSSTTCSSAFSTGTPMIQFGAGCVMPNPCTAISVENLVLDGANQTVGGVVNRSAQAFSSADHVGLYRIFGTGILVSTAGANYSGPYTNITFDTGSTNTASSGTQCVEIDGTSATQGFRRLSCTAELGEPTAAVYLDASNNSIQDVTIDGFYDGVLVGLNNSAVSNVLTNIVGDTTRHLTTKPVNTVHIAPGTGFTVQELSIMGISGVTGNYTLYDELTMAHLTDPTVAIYALGKSANNGYARFTTSPSVPTWITGTSAPAGSCIQGSMFSCTGGSGCTSTLGNTVLWGCPSGSGWLPIK